MTIVHIGMSNAPTLHSSLIADTIAVLFKFRAEVSQAHKDLFANSLKKLKNLSCVKDNRLLVGGPSITDPIERSKGFQYALLSYHHDREALAAYQASKEHHEYVAVLSLTSKEVMLFSDRDYRVTSKLMFPYKEDLVRFDFEVAPEDEYMCEFLAKAAIKSTDR